ncbi:MAG: hypothetical protein IKP47_07845 [Ruminococcus sp.]|nr:hypothetical protein [Ruminococcus sp.]
MPKQRGSMDSINLPDKEQLSSLSGGYADSRRVYREKGIDDFGNAVRADFNSATPVRMPERAPAQEEPKDEFDKLIEQEKNKKANAVKHKGFKIAGRYVQRWLVIRIAVIIVVILFILVTFFPPFTFSSTDGRVIEGNIFENRSLAQVKEDVLMSDFVYNIDALSSVNPNNYRVCTVDIDIKNFSPYKVELPGFSIVSCDPLYKDKFISARLNGGTCEISAFSVKTVTVEVLMNVHELNAEQFDAAMTSLVIRTNGMRKKLGPISIPTVPAFVFVNDSLEYHLK